MVQSTSYRTVAFGGRGINDELYEIFMGHEADGSGLTSEKNDVYDDTMKTCVEAEIFVCRLGSTWTKQ